MNFCKYARTIMVFTLFTFTKIVLLAHDKNRPEQRNMFNIGLSEDIRATIAQELNKLLANEYVLYTKTLKYHWNVKGRHFGSLHLFFQTQYEELFQFIDQIAERSQTLGIRADGTLAEFIKNSILEEQPGDVPNEEIMLADLLYDQEVVIDQLRKLAQVSAELNDWGTNNLISGLIEKHEKTSWMLRAHLQ